MHTPPDEIRAHLERVLSSEPFAQSERLRRFLRYVVERALAGEGDRLKEYVIGADVYDRGPEYDPRIDSIVRVEAGRLRAKLEAYYGGPGAGDDVVIRMRRGSYAPIFETRDTAVPPLVVPAVEAFVDTAARHGDVVPPSAGGPLRSRRARLPLAAAAALIVLMAGAFAALRREPTPAGPAATIAVLPFANYSTDEAERLLAARVTDGVTSELARIGTLGVVSHTSARRFAGSRKPAGEIAAALGAGILLVGTLFVEDDWMRVEARIVDAALDRKVWVADFNGRLTDVREVQRRIATAAAAAATRAGEGSAGMLDAR